jgi:uncharacterized protein YxjI
VPPNDSVKVILNFEGGYTDMLIMNHKLISWTTKCTVRDENNNDRYYVKGESFLSNRIMHVFNMEDYEVAVIKRIDIDFWFPHFEVYLAGRLAAVITMKSLFPRLKFNVKGINWTIVGNFWVNKFVITSRNANVATISHPPFSVGVCYLMDISHSADELLVVCAVLGIHAFTTRGR